jgi:hypothetical protein
VVRNGDILERLSPAGGRQFPDRGRATSSIEYRTDRAIVLSTTNSRVTGLTPMSSEGLGYAITASNCPLGGRERRVLRNNLARLDLSIPATTSPCSAAS